MTPERWRDVSRIYGAVLTKSEGERPAAIAQLCANDAELRQEVETLLQSGQDLAALNRAATESPTTLGLLEGRAIGLQIGVFRIDSLLGVGGMGEVYRARDAKLNRDVAIKILPPVFANDPDRLARFKREAQVLASINHPNIAAIYGFEDSGGVHALVLELVEGPTLADRIARGRIETSEALAIARQIADALEAAHEQGIVHRDLKPANIKVREDGTVKVLDFGLAKIAEAEGAGRAGRAGRAGGAGGAGRAGEAGRVAGAGIEDPAYSQSPTITTPAMTQAGMILGTAAYMSPEQAKGRPTDKRSDIWAFGCVLYEMLTGTRAFDGDDVSDTLAAILRAEPDWDRLSPHAGPTLRHLLQRCLVKDPRTRWRDIGDVRLALGDAATRSTEAAVPAAIPPVRPSRRERFAWSAAGMFAVIAITAFALLFRYPAPIPAPPVVFNVAPPPNGVLRGNPGGGTGRVPQLAVSPDGQRLVFVAAVDGRLSLWLRSLDSVEAKQLAGTEDASFPFWSPDSRSIAFFAGGLLKRVALDGAPPNVICDIGGAGRGGTWNAENTILFSSERNALQRVSASGGTPTPATVLDTSNGETGHRWPHFFPDGRHFFYIAVTGPLGSAPQPSQVRVGSLGSDPPVTLFVAESAVSYSQGHLFFWRDGSLFAQPFDPAAIRVLGDPHPVVENVAQEGLRYVSASVAPTGALAYASGVSFAKTRLTWRDRSGKVLETVGDPDAYDDLALSPDGRRVVVTILRSESGSRSGASSIWVINLERKNSTRLTFGRAVDLSPV